MRDTYPGIVEAYRAFLAAPVIKHPKPKPSRVSRLKRFILRHAADQRRQQEPK